MTIFEQAVAKSGMTAVQYLGIQNEIYMEFERLTIKAFGWTLSQLAKMEDNDPRKAYFDDTVEAMKSTLLMRAAQRED